MDTGWRQSRRRRHRRRTAGAVQRRNWTRDAAGRAAEVPAFATLSACRYFQSIARGFRADISRGPPKHAVLLVTRSYR